MTKWNLFQGCKDDLTSANQSTQYTTLTKFRIKIVGSQQMQKKYLIKFSIHL